MKLFKPKCFNEAERIFDFTIDEAMLPKGKNRSDDEAIQLLQVGLQYLEMKSTKSLSLTNRY